MAIELTILKNDFFENDQSLLKVDIATLYESLHNQPQSLDDFKFYLANAAVYSSNIERNTVSFDTYLKSISLIYISKQKKLKKLKKLRI